MFYIWQLPQHLLALVILLLYKKQIIATEQYETSIVYWLGKARWGVSLGWYIFLGQRYNSITVQHEYGHSIQSKYLGWLYLLIVGLPSITMNILTRFGILKIENYYKRWPESWADKLGRVKR